MLDFLVGNDLLSTLFAFAIVLIPAVIIHELGHFLAAKAVGITVLEFGIGFPPRIARLFTWGETEFTLNIIPLGGFVRPLGEDLIRPLDEKSVERDRQRIIAGRESSENAESNHSAQATDREILQARGIQRIMSVNEARPWPRILFFSAGALANFILAYILFFTTALLGVPAEVGGRVGLINVADTSPLSQVGIRSGDFIEQINNEYFADSAAFFERLNALAGQPVTLTVLRPEADLVFTTPPFIPDPVWASSIRTPETHVLVIGVSEGSPAQDAGMIPGDLVIAVNDRRLGAGPGDAITLLQDLSQEYAGQQVTLTLLRRGEMVRVNLVPRQDPPEGSGRIGVTIQLGFTFADHSLVFADGRAQIEPVSLPVGQALNYGVDRAGFILQRIAEFPSRLIRGATQPGENRVVSVVGISQLGGEFLQESIEEDRPVLILDYIALISIALGITNLFPIPALDGGRILFVVVELVRGKPISPEREGIVHLLGLIFLLFVGVIFIIKDLVDPLTNILPQ